MKKLVLSFFIVFLSMNTLAHDSGALKKIKETKELIELLNTNFQLFYYTDKECDDMFIKAWLHAHSTSSYVSEYVYPHLCEELKKDPDVNRALIINAPGVLKLIDPKLVSNYDELKEYLLLIFSPKNIKTKKNYYSLSTCDVGTYV